MLSVTQENTLNIIRIFFSKHGKVPSIGQLAEMLDISKPSAFAQINSLKAKGVLFERESDAATYSIVPINSGKIPLLGTIAAGFAVESFENPNQFLDLAPSLFSSKGEIFALKIMGNSMIGDQICDGDIAIIKKQHLISKNDIAAVSVDKSAFTLKRIKLLSNEVELLASNPDVKSFILDAARVEIVGKYIGLIRNSQRL